MRVTVDDDRCAGHGMCVTLCPAVFEMSEDGWAIAIQDDVPTDCEDVVREAIHSCPERAIREIDCGN
ncbi:ferredoxin [Mycobacterium bourgelatii]|uniref:Ferredoxin n=1 Tax=Mycobacterium bourgelatii TaxID=1273442 RepID=A0A7I9YP67_MYCBU|nr:ferredoxin [Mycobacterium bourgelatii]MCV6975626.1 ferredoxin [Mycobacterium bourgelatii]GFG90465.1 ferredoxin [Mycobacterium bourgelatii]